MVLRLKIFLIPCHYVLLYIYIFLINSVMNSSYNRLEIENLVWLCHLCGVICLILHTSNGIRQPLRLSAADLTLCQ